MAVIWDPVLFLRAFLRDHHQFSSRWFFVNHGLHAAISAAVKHQHLITATLLTMVKSYWVEEDRIGCVMAAILPWNRASSSPKLRCCCGVSKRARPHGQFYNGLRVLIFCRAGSFQFLLTFWLKIITLQLWSQSSRLIFESSNEPFYDSSSYAKSHSYKDSLIYGPTHSSSHIFVEFLPRTHTNLWEGLWVGP